MATYRIGIGSFSLAENGGVGVGTDATGQGNLKVEGTLKTTDLDVTGVSTFARYTGLVAESTKLGNESTLTGEFGSIGDIVIGLGNTITISGVGTTAVMGGVESVSIGTHFSPPRGGVEERPEVPIEGTVRYNTGLCTLEFYNGVDWRQFVVHSTTEGRAVWAGNQDPDGTYAHIQFTNFTTGGETQYFGELTAVTRSGGGTAGTTRGLVMGGGTPSVVNTIQYITVPAQGDALDFGDLTAARANGACVASSTRAIGVAGYESTPGLVYQNEIDYVEISTLGNAADFGDTIIDCLTSCVQSPTRGVFSQSNPSPSSNNTIAYITIASKGNAVHFGQLSVGRAPKEGSSSNTTRGVFGPDGTTLDYITIASRGNAQAFTELKISTAATAASASQTRFVFSGKVGPAASTDISSGQFATLGTVTSFGDLCMAGYNAQAMSNCHGGLGGY